MLKKLTLLATCMLIFIASFNLHAQDISDVVSTETSPHKRIPEYKYMYIEREHSRDENLGNLGLVYGFAWFIYPLTQPKVLRGAGSFEQYKNHLGKIVFDKDEPFWNWMIHPYSGSQLFLYYRANGYSRMGSLGMSFVSSALFEFTIETLTEPASVQDLYQTPMLGAAIGVGLENLSLYLLNTGNAAGKVFGHILNPFTLFPFYEGKSRIYPHVNQENRIDGLLVGAEF